MRLKTEKKIRFEPGIRAQVVCKVFHAFTCNDHHLLVYYELTKWPAPRWLDSSVDRTLNRYRRCQNMASIKVPFSRAFLKVLQGVWHIIAWHIYTFGTCLLARDSVILLLSAIKMVNTDLFTSSLVHFRRPVEPKKCFMLSRIVMFVKEPSSCCSDRFISFGEHCWTEDFEVDYFEQKIGIIPHLRPLDLQGELISIEFYLMGC